MSRIEQRGAGGSQRPRILVDTNVWMDFFTNRMGTARRISELLEEVVRRGGVVMTAVISLKDLFYLVPAHLEAELAQDGEQTSLASKRAVAWGCIRMLRERSVIVGADYGDCLEAEFLRSLDDDFGDALMLAAAKRGDADYLLTENAELRRRAPLAALSVEACCELFGMGGAYDDVVA